MERRRRDRPSYLRNGAAGDIKYRDVNGDMRIDDEDFTVIGNTHARFAYGLNVTLTWRNFELFAYMSAQTGATKRHIGATRIYAVYGPNAKYSVTRSAAGPTIPASGSIRALRRPIRV